MLNFQDMIAKLTQFWVKHGCIVHQGHDLEVGAGTFNPATFLRALGPEPYSAVYVEPSRRPQDGRYGENPNRLQNYHQMQVILKPSPPNILDLYIESLGCIGLNLQEHDIRFVHDDWENPTIGASGLGWEVWVDGMEVTQFTYFQMIGSLPVRPVSGEITYGLERIAMYLQNVNSVFDLKYSDEISYGEIFKRNEWEWSHYNFNEATIAMWRRHFDEFEKEAKKLIAASLPLPAYDFVIKASHAFNILEARGVISVTERTGYISRIRSLAKELAEKYVEMRELLNFPLLKEKKTTSSPSIKLNLSQGNSEEKQDFLLEIGSEELPHTFVPIGLASLERAIKDLLQKSHLKFEKISLFGTPRRLAIFVEKLVGASEERKIEKKGPPISLAFDPKGNPTQVGLAFFKSLSFTPLTLQEIQSGHPIFFLKNIKDSDYLFAVFEEKGKSTREILAQELPSLIESLSFPKKMRWAHFDVQYPRPIRWLVALYGSEVIPFQIADVISDQISFGHRQISNRPIKISSAKNYVSQLREHHVMVDIEERKQAILDGIATIEKQNDLSSVALAKVLPTVLYLVEWPFVLKGNFDPSFLKVPHEVLTSEMIEHQKYIPLKAGQSLAPHFLIVANNFASEKIRKGNEKALTPRLSDGLFLYEEDLKNPLEFYNEKLKTLTFHKELGSVYAKVVRIGHLVTLLHKYMPQASKEKAQRAAFLCKADLTCELVKEFPELQGTIGYHYALKSSEDNEVAIAIDEHWMPRGENAPLPKTPCGQLLSLADKIDNLLSCFSLDLLPTSSSDPYALRRQTIGMIKLIIENHLSFPLQEILTLSFEEFLKNPEMDVVTSKKIKENQINILAAISEFFKNRFKTVLGELGFSKDEIESVLSKKIDDIYETYCLISYLRKFREKEHKKFLQILTLYTRCRKILQSQEPVQTEIIASCFKEDSEKHLFARLEKLKKDSLSYEKSFQELSELEPILSNLFDTVTIIDENKTIRNNRLALLQSIKDQCDKLIDFSKIQEHSIV